MNILVVSPHRDDAAFSLAITLRNWLDFGHRLTILNVFTRSAYAPYGELSGVPEAERVEFVSAMRKREDERVLEVLRGGVRGSVTMIDLELEDAPIRMRCDNAQVCDVGVDAGDEATGKIRAALVSWMEGQAGGGEYAVMLPLGVGRHVDHVTVRDAALPLMRDVACAYYEDLPYAARVGADVELAQSREDVGMRLDETLRPMLCGGTGRDAVEIKRRVALLYGSQIDAAVADQIADFSGRYGGGERVWANAAWLSSAACEGLSSREAKFEAEALRV